MEDDHVDRPGVEVRQRMQLTGTNRSIGLIALIFSVHDTDANGDWRVATGSFPFAIRYSLFAMCHGH